MIISDLDKVSLFRYLDLRTLEQIAAFSEKLSLYDGDILISENEADRHDIFILCKGRVEVISSGTGITSDEVSLSSPDKEVFGEISWLINKKRSATIRCVGETEAIRVDGERLSSFLESTPTAGYSVMKQIATLLADRLDKTDALLKQILWNSQI